MRKNKYLTKFIFIFTLFAYTIMMVGCWDRKEIEDLGLIVCVAIDRPKTTKGKEQEEKEEKLAHDVRKAKHRLTVTQQFVVPKAMGGKESTSMSNEKAYSNIGSEGDTLFQVVRQFYTTSSRTPYYRHLKVIIISEEIARALNIEKLMNFFLRDPEVSRDINMMIAKGSARDVLEIKPIKEQLPTLALLSLTKNASRTARMAPKLMLGDMSKKMASNESFIVPRVIGYGNRVQLAGAAVVHGKTNKMLGWLGEEETEAINWLSGEAEGGVVEAIDKRTGELIVYEFDNIKSKIQPKVSGDKISFNVKIEADGVLGEDWLTHGDAFNEEFLRRMEEGAKLEMLPMINGGLKKTQKIFKVDVVGFGRQLNIKYPKVWEKVKGNWDEQFSKIPVEVDLQIHVRGFGRKGRKR